MSTHRLSLVLMHPQRACLNILSSLSTKMKNATVFVGTDRAPTKKGPAPECKASLFIGCGGKI
jgi:hypothetical protein